MSTTHSIQKLRQIYADLLGVSVDLVKQDLSRPMLLGLIENAVKSLATRPALDLTRTAAFVPLSVGELITLDIILRVVGGAPGPRAAAPKEAYSLRIFADTLREKLDDCSFPKMSSDGLSEQIGAFDTTPRGVFFKSFWVREAMVESLIKDFDMHGQDIPDNLPVKVSDDKARFTKRGLK